MSKIIFNGVDYAGGSGNYFNPVIYSDTERKIGVWRDNKPLYQKTFIWNETISGDTTNKSISLDNPDYAFIVDASGINFAGAYVPLPYVHSNDVNNAGVFINSTKDAVGFRIASNMTLSYVCITIRYTKTTDVAGSGDYNTYGVPTVHYSTSEQVIGTWLGKPLYERVFELTQDTTLTADTWVKTEFNQDTKKALIKVTAVVGLSGAVIEALSGSFIDGKIALNSARAVGLNVASNAMLIIQYTKTTD